ncbi:MAG: hypothetical protein HY938_03045 [Nitrosomonadales bacterium]|nr:hypothetical protein [Nitrosomonadales bacterium]
MKKFLMFAVIAVISAFAFSTSLSAIALDQLEQAVANYQWLLAGSGLLCFMELRRRG